MANIVIIDIYAFLGISVRRKIDCLMTRTACLFCFISTVNDRNKKTITSGASSGHITKLKQSIIIRCLWVVYAAHL